MGLDGLEPSTSVLSGVWSKTNRIQAVSDTKRQVRCLLFWNKTEVRFEHSEEPFHPSDFPNDGGFVQEAHGRVPSLV